MALMIRLYLIVLCTLLAMSGFAASLSDHSFAVVSISADEALEDSDSDTMRFVGHFLMQSGEWELQSHEAVVAGPPDRPDRVLLQGSPARFLIERSSDDRMHIIEATAPSIEYVRATNLLSLSGGATLRLDGEVIRSAALEFDLSSDRYQSLGSDGVSIEVQPAN